jgi:hypothetical protein
MTEQQIQKRDEVVRKLLLAVELTKNFSSDAPMICAFKSIIGVEFFGEQVKIAFARERVAGDPPFEEMCRMGLVEGFDSLGE